MEESDFEGSLKSASDVYLDQKTDEKHINNTFFNRVRSDQVLGLGFRL